jgi:hypothetical protein
MSVAKDVLDKTFQLNKLEGHLQLWSKIGIGSNFFDRAIDVRVGSADTLTRAA